MCFVLPSNFSSNMSRLLRMQAATAELLVCVGDQMSSLMATHAQFDRSRNPGLDLCWS